MVLATAALLGAGFVALVWWEVCNTVAVSVVNDGPTVTRLSGCVDDSVDLDAGAAASIDVNGQTGCNVFTAGKYQGCLIVHHGDAADGRAVQVFALIDRKVSEQRCMSVA